MAIASTNAQDVFINCRFDPAWHSKFEALAFAVIGCGFRVRCARELDDAAGTRIDKLYRIIQESRYGIHDISCVELDAANNLPRFNMPLELGFFLAAKQYGGVGQKEKRCLIFESEPYRYQQFISDLNGMDIAAHGDDPRTMVRRVRDFLFTSSRRKTIPTANNLVASYDAFQAARPKLLADAGLGHGPLLFADYEMLAIEWVRANAA
ncbi:hypothetical protein OF829_08025 [Sphingomonas sp. LB-2]|uniref:hypothetical protein n=1 Tax=Sphingomonas caeni TaxID=2984949 RepID=UPI0022300D73|nr:hypothetical protein [Sphingomonas caeni]MCW3847185.1 hypothetical protein [Sphingomonas caeni]